MKKIGIVLAIVFCVLLNTVVLASSSNITNDVQNNKEPIIQTDTVNQLVELKDREKTTSEDYQEAYGSETYGLAAYVLNKIQTYSIPLCFVGIAISAIYQYVLGIRKLDTRDKGFAIMISIITVFIIAQVLPLVFAIVVKGWRG